MMRTILLVSTICMATPAFAWQTVDDHKDYKLKLEAVPTLHQLVKDQACESLTGVKDCLPHVSVEAVGAKEVRGQLRWKF